MLAWYDWRDLLTVLCNAQCSFPCLLRGYPVPRSKLVTSSTLSTYQLWVNISTFLTASELDSVRRLYQGHLHFEVNTVFVQVRILQTVNVNLCQQQGVESKTTIATVSLHNRRKCHLDFISVALAAVLSSVACQTLLQASSPKTVPCRDERTVIIYNLEPLLNS